MIDLSTFARDNIRRRRDECARESGRYAARVGRWHYFACEQRAAARAFESALRLMDAQESLVAEYGHIVGQP